MDARLQTNVTIKIWEMSLFIDDPDIVTGIGVWTSSLNPENNCCIIYYKI